MVDGVKRMTFVALLGALSIGALAPIPVGAMSQPTPVRIYGGRGPLIASELHRVSASSLSGPKRTSATATLSHGRLTVAGQLVATGVTTAVWSNDGTALFYVQRSGTGLSGHIFALRPGAHPVPLAVSQNGWTLAALGRQDVAFDVNGHLVIGTASGNLANTGVDLATASKYAFQGATFSASPNGRYVVEASASGQLTMVTLPDAGHTLRRQTLVGSVAADRYGWGVWSANSMQFCYVTHSNYNGSNGLYVWHAATKAITNITTAMQRVTGANQYAVIGFLANVHDDIIVEALSLGDVPSGAYLAVNTRGEFVQRLWQGGFLGSVGTDGVVQFTVVPAVPRQTPYQESVTVRARQA